MTPCVIWFNGPSRDRFLRMPKWSTEIGCNHILLDRAVDHVVCYDHQMLDRQHRDLERPDQGYWCRRGQAAHFPGWRDVPYSLTEAPEQSGTLAVHLALHLGFKDLFIIGCDWGLDNISVYDYGRRNGIKKYTNNQKQLLKRLGSRPGVTISLVGNQLRDVNLPHIPYEDFELLVESQTA